MRKCVQAFGRTGDPEARGAATEMLFIHALRCGRPRTAAKFAEGMLENVPDHVLSLTILMSVKMEDRQVADAKRLASRILTLTEGKESPARKRAQEVLAIDADDK